MSGSNKSIDSSESKQPKDTESNPRGRNKNKKHPELINSIISQSLDDIKGKRQEEGPDKRKAQKGEATRERRLSDTTNHSVDESNDKAYDVNETDVPQNGQSGQMTLHGDISFV